MRYCSSILSRFNLCTLVLASALTAAEIFIDWCNCSTGCQCVDKPLQGLMLTAVRTMHAMLLLHNRGPGSLVCPGVLEL